MFISLHWFGILSVILCEWNFTAAAACDIKINNQTCEEKSERTHVCVCEPHAY